jgi:hypothetical protein
MNAVYGQNAFSSAGGSHSSSGGFDLSSTMTRIFGLSMFASFFTGSGAGVGGNSLKLIVLGMLVEFGRRFVQWVVERFRLRTFFATLNDTTP